MRKFLLLLILLGSVAMYGQNQVSGTVVDADSGMPLLGASVQLSGTSTGVVTDFDGNFTLNVDVNSGKLNVSYVGFKSRSIDFNITGNQINLGQIRLRADENVLSEIVLVGSGLIDLAADRETPIAVSTVTAQEVQRKSGNQEFPEILKNTPSVHVAGQAGGYGDSRMYVRGFDQTNTAFLLNGQPINGMEDGKMYWSNWQGMTDVANAIQIQRGLGSSKLAISSVGGTVNIVTKATDLDQGGFALGMVGDNNYQKTSIGYNTGLMESGWGASVMFTHWAGDGYNKGTSGWGQNYFISLGYKASEKHQFNFLLFGAPQQHKQNFTKSISEYLEYGRRYNNNYGLYNGKILNERTNYYHKPVANLNWDYQINDKTSLATVLYASWGRGGGTGPWGSSANKVTTHDGLVNFDQIHQNNQNISDGIGSFGNEGYAIRASVNNHQWYGLVSNLNYEIDENWSLNTGVDVRTYTGTHYQRLSNLLGLNGWYVDPGQNAQIPDGYEVTKVYSPNPWKSTFDDVPEDQRLNYDYDERISYGGIFGQVEYSVENFSAFVQGALSSQSHVRWDRFQYTKENEKSESVTNTGYNIKGGASYKIENKHAIYANAGHYSRQPFHDNIYLNFGNEVNPLTKNEKILGLELGYSYTSRVFSANLNLYRTSWKDRVTTTSVLDPITNELTYEQNSGVHQLHSGVEFDFIVRPIDDLDIKGFASFGDWKYDDDVHTNTYDESQNLISTTINDVKGGKVGDAAQTNIGLGAAYHITDKFSVDADYRYYSKLYANRVVKENIELPDYNLVDLGLNYNMNLGEGKLNFRVNVNNLFSKVYIAELRSAVAAGDGDVTYRGINVVNDGYFGNGRTWNFSMRYSF